jgi:hypothetical protein
MLCVEIKTIQLATGPTQYFSPVATQPTDQTTCAYVVSSGSDLSILAGNYDYTDAASMWGFAFSSVFMLWYLAKNLGMIINAVKRW